MSVYGFLMMKYNLPMIEGRSDDEWLKSALDSGIILLEEYQKCKTLIEMYRCSIYSYESWEEK